ncbi:putative membrane protein YeaQ/YmgE (transglycosylase-associated protein family) [Nitrobacteraceae bacterium AZCC 2146]
MKIITLLAVMAMLLQAVIGTKSSVGGPMTMLLIVFLAMLAVGIQQALVKKRGPLGWIVNIIASVIGGFVAVSFVGMAMDMIRPLTHLEGSLANSHHPLLYISSAGMAIFTVLGSWITLQIVYRAAALLRPR